MRAKFRCQRVENDEYGQRVFMSAVYGDGSKDNSENNQFSEATPCGNLEMYISNPNAKDFIKQGQEYYLDFTPSPMLSDEEITAIYQRAIHQKEQEEKETGNDN